MAILDISNSKTRRQMATGSTAFWTDVETVDTNVMNLTVYINDFVHH